MKNKEIYLKVEQDWKMILSEWLIFLISIVFISSIFVPIIRIIKEYPDDGMKLGLLVIFVFAMMKLVTWVRVPTTYSTNDVVRDIKIELQDNATKRTKEE